MKITDETVAQLRSMATAGDAQAALKLGQLLCLTAADPSESDAFNPTWPEERWLRAAVEAHPDDIAALMLLTGRLAQQNSYWEAMLEMDPDVLAEYGQDEDTVSRRHSETKELYDRIRAAGPHDHVEAGLDELAVLLGLRARPAEPAPAAGYSFYVLEDETWSGSVRHCASIVACDAEEIRWACGQWLALSEDGFGDLTLTVYEHGSETNSIDLGQHLDNEAVDWDAAVPDLFGPRLPMGLPIPGLGLYYGFSGEAE
ncbi:hypothetical protein CLV63_102233 [Murinocardiopsis flavida]|uniref:Tetratricopeptide repeat protein n=1 Tax=Murinocardiopsis flavida TaxID=645275 RepID=A0A2P8DSB7_9ACTN|nr:hypothetical protein [Murinocardiopsis flavida]PSL00107.1 hypothetical protein CLV63_102233 [Murinocardiopsis flavida]